MVMRRWDPLREIHRIEENMNRLWRGILPGVEAPSHENWGIPLDVVEEGENVVVHASLPGVEPGRYRGVGGKRRPDHPGGYAHGAGAPFR